MRPHAPLQARSADSVTGGSNRDRLRSGQPNRSFELEIIPFRPEFKSDVLDLIVASNAMSSALKSRRTNSQICTTSPRYQVRGGNFWLAVVDRRVVGTISLLDIGNHQGALRKMFVHPEFRGSERRTATRLFETLIDWARDRQVREIFLGTTSKFLAAHRFYARNGFSEVPRSALPSAFPIMTVETRFFHRRV
jgi:N-acetylglutamate synthase-like GNAT family acetyltransferase